MLPLRNIVKTSKALNSRPATIVLVVLGIAASIMIFPKLYSDGLTRSEALGEAVVIIVPLLMAKLANLALLSLADYSLSKDAAGKTIPLGTARARARIVKILVERKSRFYTLDAIALGIERHLLRAAGAILSLVGGGGEPPVTIVCEEPFLMARIMACKGASKESSRLSVYSEGVKGEVLAKLVSSSLDSA